MKKLMLDVDALVVESFETHRAHGVGTVAANQVRDFQQQIKTYPNCSEIDGCPSALGCSYASPCPATYEGTCKLSCAASCLSDCFNTGCNGCSGPICAAE